MDGEAEPVPARQIGSERQRLEQIEREVEAIGLLGVDREADADPRRVAGEIEQQRIHLGKDAITLRHLVARMQCRQLD